MSAEIKIQKLTKKYPNGTQALKGIDLEIEEGSFFTLLGPNGAGKSTLIKILTTLIDKDSGAFMIGGLNVENNKSLIQKHIGVASQDNELDPSETPENLLVFQGRLFGLSKKEAVLNAKNLIEKFQLEAERGKKVINLSGGNKRRLHCALALVHKPKTLFLDEPTVGMDPLARATFWDVISEMNKKENVTVFLTTQYLEEADKHAKSMALILDGQIRFAGSVTNFKHMVNPSFDASLEDSYLSFIKGITLPEPINI